MIGVASRPRTPAPAGTSRAGTDGHDDLNAVCPARLVRASAPGCSGVRSPSALVGLVSHAPQKAGGVGEAYQPTCGSGMVMPPQRSSIIARIAPAEWKPNAWRVASRAFVLRPSHLPDV